MMSHPFPIPCKGGIVTTSLVSVREEKRKCSKTGVQPDGPTKNVDGKRTRIVPGRRRVKDRSPRSGYGFTCHFSNYLFP